MQVVGIIQKALEVDEEERVYTSLEDVQKIMTCLRILSRVSVWDFNIHSANGCESVLFNCSDALSGSELYWLLTDPGLCWY